MNRVLEYAVWSGRGCVRPGNEDNYYLNGKWNSLESVDKESFLEGRMDDGDPVLLAVCDGMGGREAGEKASFMAVSGMNGLKERLQSEQIQESLGRWAVDMNHVICEEIPGSGSTVAMLYVEDGKAYAANIGDSRIYLLRAHQLKQISEDHSEVARLVRIGAITPEEARTHPDRHAINRHLGVNDDRHCEPEAYPPVSLEAGDVFLLCSDGVTDMVEDDILLQLLDAAEDASAAARMIYRTALENGGEDNTTAMVLRVGDEGMPGKKKKPLSFLRALFSRG